MEREALLAKNCARWRSFAPQWSNEVVKTSFVSEDFPSEEERKSLLVEVEKSVKSVKKKTDVIYACGVRSGAYYIALKEWLSKENHHLVLFEPDIKEIALLFATELGEEILSNPKVYVFYLDAVAKSLELPVSFFLGASYEVFALKSCLNRKSTFLEDVKKRIAFLDSLYAPIVAEFQNLGSLFFYNYFRNLFKWPNSYLADPLFKKFAGVPAIICAAGPSLQKNGHLLQSLRDKALIFAGGTAMNAVNAQGVTPHFGVGIDPNMPQITRIIMNNAFEVPFFYRNRMYAPALDMIHGPLLHCTGSSGYEISNYFDKEFDISTDHLTEGFNVINFSMSIAMALGCNPIIFVGLDLAYSNDTPYALGVVQHPVHDKRDWFRTKSPDEELVQRNDIYGRPISTLWKWVNESVWLSSFALSKEDTTIINATEGGIGLPLIPNMTLEEVANNYLQKQFDLDLRVFAEIQKAKMPNKVSFENIVKVLEKLKNSLQKALILLEEMKKSIGDNEKLQGLKTQLECESSYKYILKDFEEYYNRVKKRSYWRLEVDKDHMSEQEFLQCKNTLELGKKSILEKVVNTTLEQLEKAVIEEKNREHKIFEHHKNIQVEESCPIPPASKAERYSCDEKCFILIDPELALHHEEVFSKENAIIVEKAFYKNGNVQYVNFKKANLLHGSCSYYSEDGFLLGQSFYINGLRQGKATKRYASKALASVQRFKDGYFEGVQLFYYENGMKKSILDYKNGLLHGDVFLYHPNGQIARELHFINGKRQGIERIWTQDGVLLIEAHFKENLPIGIARAWHENGALAYENDYGPDGLKASDVKIWNKEGKLFEGQNKEKDYFKEAAKETEHLTANIVNIFKQASSVASFLEQVEGKENPVGHVEKSLALVRAEIENLQKIGKTIMFDSGLDPANTEEAFWKTPSMQKSIEAHIEQMTAHINEEISKLKDSFTQVMLDTAKKLNEENPENTKKE